MTLSRHENGAGATPTCCRRRRRQRQQNGGGGAQLYTGSVYVYREVANSAKKRSPYRKTRVVCRQGRNILSGAFEFLIYTKLYF